MMVERRNTREDDGYKEKIEETEFSVEHFMLSLLNQNPF